MIISSGSRYVLRTKYANGGASLLRVMAATVRGLVVAHGGEPLLDPLPFYMVCRNLNLYHIVLLYGAMHSIVLLVVFVFTL